MGAIMVINRYGEPVKISASSEFVGWIMELDGAIPCSWINNT